jgi:uncharacterized membrane protein
MLNPSLLTVDILSSSEDTIIPGNTKELKVIVVNHSPEDLKIVKVYLHKVPQGISDWFRIIYEQNGYEIQRNYEQFNLASGQSNTVAFRWTIPNNALSGNYEYELIIDSDELQNPKVYPQKLNIGYQKSEKQLPQEPTFYLELPGKSSNSGMRSLTNSFQPLNIDFSLPFTQILITVDNRTSRVDDFRIECEDISKQWFTVKYPYGEDKLHLNPIEKGEITFELHPPSNADGGLYSPTIKLKSTNNPTLFIADILYFQIPLKEKINLNLEPPVHTIKNESVIYLIKLENQANITRKISLSVQEQNPDIKNKLFDYNLSKSQVELEKEETQKVELEVTPIKKWKRPLFKNKEREFIVKLNNLDPYPLAINEISGKTFWSPRPWWQFWFWILLLLLLLLGGIWLIYQLIRYADFKPPKDPPQVSLSSFYNLYNYTDTIFLDFQVENLPYRPENTAISIFLGDKEIRKLELKELLEESKIDSKTKQYSEGCVYNKSPFYELSCININTGISQPGNYEFSLQVSTKDGKKKLEKQSTNIEIKEPPKPQIEELRLSSVQVKPKDTFSLDFQVVNYQRLAEIKIIGEPVAGIKNNSTETTEITLDKDTITKNCLNQNGANRCIFSNPFTFSNPGTYQFTVTAKSAYEKHNETPITVTSNPLILGDELQIVYFKANDKTSNIEVQYKETIDLDWYVTGNNVKVDIEYLEPNLLPKGKAKLNVYPDNSFEITLKATDSVFGTSVEKKLFIKVNKPTSDNSSDTSEQLPNEVIEVPDLLRGN